MWPKNKWIKALWISRANFEIAKKESGKKAPNEEPINYPSPLWVELCLSIVIIVVS